MQIKSYLTHKNIFLFGLVLLAAGIPVSRFLVSVAQFVLLGNWIIEGKFLEKWNLLKKSKAFWAYTGIILFYAAGLLWTSDYAYGLKDIRIKLPMLWLPVLFFSSPKLGKKEYHSVLHFFVAAVVFASFWSIMVYSGLTKIQIHDVRDISRFESHIRFSLMIVLSVLYLFFVLLKKDTRYKLIYAFTLAWLLGFLILLQSFTGIVIAGLIAFTALSWILVSKKSLLIKLSFSVFVISATGYMLYLVSDEWKKFHEIKQVDYAALPYFTKSNNRYYNDTNSRLTENGNLVWILIQNKEMKKEWNKKSWRPYDSLDYHGNPLYFTLVRYLASKGLTRDSAGVNQLSESDVKNIENGFPNYMYTSTSGMRTRIHELIWEIDQVKLNQNPTGHSLAMRLEFWKTAWHIIKENKIAGVGTGDVEIAFKEQYIKDKTSLQPRWQLRSHNQFFAVTVALGFIGLFLFLLSFFSPFLFCKKHSHFFILFMLIQFLSFFNEDTLETQAGVTFCVFFTQFLFHHDEYNL
ncbi:MAG TPA: O-antigen ligase family protein [Bacteroidia bacterium]|jgi:hypothetical protein|nr:O-antigen ligase family protein [Bacteroidia bacterium]